MNSPCPYICNNKTEYGYCKTTGCINPKRQSQTFTTTDGYWYHGNGKVGGEFHPTKPNDEERYGEYVKVKHGRNIATEYDDVDEFICSECGLHLENWVSVEVDEDTDEKTYHEYRLQFCPNCGARMDESEAEE